MSQIQYFKALLLKHDWTYMYSDDHRAFAAGMKESKELKNLAKLNPLLEALYKQEQRRIFG